MAFDYAAVAEELMEKTARNRYKASSSWNRGKKFLNAIDAGKAKGRGWMGNLPHSTTQAPLNMSPSQTVMKNVLTKLHGKTAARKETKRWRNWDRKRVGSGKKRPSWNKQVHRMPGKRFNLPREHGFY